MQTFNSFNELAAGQGQPLHSDMSVFNKATVATKNDISVLADKLGKMWNELEKIFADFDFSDHPILDKTLDDMFLLLGEAGHEATIVSR